MRFHLSGKFYLGIVFVVVSLIVGKVTTILFFVNIDNGTIRWVSLIVYLLSWPFLVMGIWWVGQEYAASIKKYFTYHFYGEKVKNKTRKAISTMETKLRKPRQRLKEKTQEAIYKTKELGLKLRRKRRS